MDNLIRQLYIIFMTIGIIICVFYALSHIKGAPWLPTRTKKVREMLSLVNVQPGEVLYDLGCGDGRVLIIAARRYKAKAVGIEINVMFYLWCQFLIAILGLRSKVKVKYGNFFKSDLSNADIVICYLLQETNDKLEEKLIQELKPTARVASNSFKFRKLSIISEDYDKKIYIYQR